MTNDLEWVSRIYRALHGTQTADEVNLWLLTYNRELGAKPIELIQTGRGAQVLEEAERLANGDSDE
jgi:hypothetical protein